MKNGFSYFKNTECEYFPCHKVENDESFNCLFCFCPLYQMEDCSGNFTLTKEGIKDCSACLIPHNPKNYDYIISKMSKE
jgi:Zn-finger protein